MYKSLDESSVVNNYTRKVSDDLVRFVEQFDYVSYVSGYWEYYSQPGLNQLAWTSVSANNLTMITTVSFVSTATDTEVNDISVKLLEFAKKRSNRENFVGATGLFPLFAEIQAATTVNFELIDAVVLPIALIILGITLKSYRHIGVALCNFFVLYFWPLLFWYQLLDQLLSTRLHQPL